MARPPLDDLIDQAALLPPGPEAWAPIFAAYPETTHKQLAQKFREASERLRREADELEEYQRRRFIESADTSQ
jgi:hypothetical protein